MSHSLADQYGACEALGASRLHLTTTFDNNQGEVMKEYLNNEQFNQNDEQIVQNDEQIVTLDARAPYQPPTLTVMGKVEHLTAILFGGVPDLLAVGNIV
jgi:hypothetical protein